MHGYQEDMVEVKPNKRKQTFANTTEDGSHAAFASICHYYISSDNRTYKKTKKVYEHLGINTSVLKPQEFLNALNGSLRLHIRNVEHLAKVILSILNTKKYEEVEVEDRTHRTYYLNFFIFDFFNRLSVIMGDEEDKPTFMLGRVSPTNSSGIYVFEIRKLIQRLNYFFGVEDVEFGNVNEDVLRGQTWSGLVYQFDGFHFRLLSHNGYVQFYLNFGD